MEQLSARPEGCPADATHCGKMFAYKVDPDAPRAYTMRWRLGADAEWSRSANTNDEILSAAESSSSTIRTLPTPVSDSAPASHAPELVTLSDQAGIERFVAPPAPEPVKEKVRVSTLRRAWGWLA